MPNQLAHESSPYLLQHANNPVDWFAWGPAAIDKARREDKPIFLSIGYSACHWCHVMEHESFENPRIAAVLNEYFVSIKVDREERPDLDQIYMTAVQMMTGHGGWPMSVFLTPELQPFYGGTYWPDAARGGMPGFDQILMAVHDAWVNRREQAREQAAKLTDYLRTAERAAADESTGELSPDLLRDAARSLEGIFDFRHGGFGRAPKFPHPMDLRVLLRVARRNKNQPAALSMATTTLDKMAAGGLYDQLGGGFHRYSVDERWLVPHFEKMLYDNALLALAYLEGHLATGEEKYGRIVRETLDYVLRDMTDPAGGFYSTEDADSEGHEGKFYVWTPGEIERVLGRNTAETFCYAYDVTGPGNFEGQNILNLPKTIEQCAAVRHRDTAELAAELATGRAKLLAVRDRRVRPGRDDKVLVSWNGLMIDAFAQAAGPLREPRYLQAATAAADFLLQHLRRPDGRLLHSWRGGQAKLDAYLDDYACLMNALVSLYEAGFDERYIDEAVRLADIVLAQFADPAGGGFFYTAADHEQLIARTKDLHDGSVPSATAMTTTALVRLAHLTGRTDYQAAAEATLRGSVALMKKAPTAVGQMLLALDLYLGPTSQIAILGNRGSPDTSAALDDLWARYIPDKVIALRPATGEPAHRSAALETMFAGKTAQGADPTVFVCRDFACDAPVSGRAEAIASWDKLEKS